MSKQETRRTKDYPWKSFIFFLGLYLVSLITHYPVLLNQARIYLEIRGDSLTTSPILFAVTAMIQPLLLGVIAIYFGCRFARKVNLRSLMAERIEEERIETFEQKRFTFKDSIPFAVGVAVVVAVFELGFDVVFQNGLPEIYHPHFTVPSFEQALSSIVYTGLGQELLLRLGVMTAVIYVLSAKGEALDQGHYMVGMIFTALLYAFAQYSSVIGVVEFNFFVLLRILLLTGLAGILYGWLYAKFHFEAAAFSHMLAHTLIILGNILVVGMIAS